MRNCRAWRRPPSSTNSQPRASGSMSPRARWWRCRPTARCARWSGAGTMPRASIIARSRAKRQPGSAFKPFVFLTAVEAGLMPETFRLDAPIDIKGWRPENYTHEYFGSVTLTQALAMSLNTVAVRLGIEVGAEERRTYRAPARHFLQARGQRLDCARHVGSLAQRTGRRLCAVRQWRTRYLPACRDEDPNQ